jgi:hypothetical protein
MPFEENVMVTECYHKCPFFGTTMDGMQCNHPIWQYNKNAYANMIITQDNSHGRVPDECPLRIKPYLGNLVIKLEPKPDGQS